MGNRALSEVRAAKPVRTCELLKVDLFLFPEVVFYYIGSGGLLVWYVSCFHSVKFWSLNSCRKSPLPDEISLPATPPYAYMNATVTQTR